MDPQTFDRLTAGIADRRSRRTALGLLAGAGLASLVSPRWARGAQRSDRDWDGLYDDDETDVYGTNPDVYDTDGDGFGDGEEIYYGGDPLSAGSSAGVVGNGNDVSLGGAGTGPDNTIDIAPAPVCLTAGYPCDYDAQCCGQAFLCCFDGVSLRTECTDVTAAGGVCPY